MKAPVIWFAFALVAGSRLAAGEIQPGASLQEVKDTLGKPRGVLQQGERQVLHYERGEVEVENGRVTRVALRSAEEHATLAARQEQAREERAARRAEMRAEGTSLRDRKMADPTFLAAPISYQITFWEDFTRRYPEVSVMEPLTIARMRFNEQIEAKRQRDEQAERLAEIEERLAEAERQPVYYPVRTYSSGYGRRHHSNGSNGLGPFTYTFFDKPLPPYTTPSGNPAGNLTGNPAGSLYSPYFNPPASNPALPEQSGQSYPRWEQEEGRGRSTERHDEPDHRHWRERR